MAKVKLAAVLINALHKKPPPTERDTGFGAKMGAAAGDR
jgi:hypothetical protein